MTLIFVRGQEEILGSTLVLGNKTSNIHRYCGPKVAAEKAWVIPALEKTSLTAETKAVDDSMEEGSTDWSSVLMLRVDN